MQEEEYTFVTLDGNDVMPADAVITLADDTVMLSDTDMMDLYSTDMDGADISFIV